MVILTERREFEGCGDYYGRVIPDWTVYMSYVVRGSYSTIFRGRLCDRIAPEWPRGTYSPAGLTFGPTFQADTTRPTFRQILPRRPEPRKTVPAEGYPDVYSIPF